MKPYFDSLCGPFEVDWEDHNRLNRWQEDEFELGDRVATALMGGYLVGFDTDKILGRLRVKQVIRGLKSIDVYLSTLEIQ